MSAPPDGDSTDQVKWADDQPDGGLDLERLKAVARRQAVVFVACCAIGLAAGVAYLLTAVPLYTASTQILIDDRNVRAVEDLAAGTIPWWAQDAAVESQVEVIRSEQIGLAAVERLGLAERPRDVPAKPSLVGLLQSLINVRSWFAPPAVPDDDAADRKVAALNGLRGGMNVRRVVRTYVLSIEYTSADRGEAARVANGIADAYIAEQLESKYDSTRRAGDWLRERIKELRNQTRDADLAVQRFRAENNLLAAGGTLISEQQLSELNSQLVIARSDTARANARLERIKAILDSREPSAVVSEALAQPVFNDLRSKYLERAKRASDLAERLGENDAQVVQLRNEMRNYERLMFEELGWIAESYRSDLEIAMSRERSLEDSLTGALGTTAEANELLVALHELERQAQTYRTLHQNFLSRFEEACRSSPSRSSMRES